MSKIRSTNTKPELLVRRGLFARGLRYRLHYKSLPGRPDLVFPKWQAIVQVHGCFWHGHARCARFKEPADNRSYWSVKIEKNRERDVSNEAAWTERGWRVLTIWECALVGRHRLILSDVLDRAQSFIEGKDFALTIRSANGHP
ncbi:very short patch repair endonuclease [Rhizobium phaseoli]|nr:very short patch repair endonuclease [Rhizobium phaseoli]